MDLRLPATEAPSLPAITESERLGDAYAVVGLDARRQVVALFREALDRLGAVPNSALAERRPGPVRIGGLVVTRQHPMTAKGTVFLALEDETGHGQRHALAGHVGAAPRRGPPPRAAARRRRAPARVVGRERGRPRDRAADERRRAGRRPGGARPAFASWATPACAGSASASGSRCASRRASAASGLDCWLGAARGARRAAREGEEAAVPGRRRGEQRAADGPSEERQPNSST